MKKDGNLHQGHWQRVREKALKEETACWTDKEMLELTLQFIYTRGDVNEIACRLLAKFGTFSRVLDAQISDLAEVKGVGRSTAEKISLLPKISNFYNISCARQPKIFINNTEDCINLARSYLSNLKHERLYMFCLNKSLQVIHDFLLGEGEESLVRTSMEEIMLKIAQTKAVFVIFAHNHPSGKVTPSNKDNEFTKKVTQVLGVYGINVLDHIIIGDKNLYYSYRTYGDIQAYEKDLEKVRATN